MTTIIRQLRDLVPLRPLSVAESMRVADQQATRLLALMGVLQGPVPESVIADLPRVHVERMTPAPVSGAAQWSKGRWLIVVNGGEPYGRQRFSMAHELKHVLDSPFTHFLYPSRDGQSAPDRTEQICDYFAACLLMPRAWVKSAYCNDGVQRNATGKTLRGVGDGHAGSAVATRPRRATSSLRRPDRSESMNPMEQPMRGRVMRSKLVTMDDSTSTALPRAVLYLRVSTPSQVNTDYDPEGISIPAQRGACERKAAQLGVEIIDTFVEPGRSATSMDKRPAFQAMLERIRTQRDVNFVIVYKLSRMNRNRLDDALVLMELKKHGVALISATEQIDDTPVGQLMHGILASFNEFRSREDGADISYKMGEKARRGGTLGKAVVGYMNVRENFEGREVRTIKVDPDRAPLVRQAFEIYATGNYSIADLEEEMQTRGLTTRTGRTPGLLSGNQLTRMLTNPYYTGRISYKGETYQGRHEPIVEPKLFDEVQIVVAQRATRDLRRRTHNHYLKGVLWCWECSQRGIESRLIRQYSKGNGGDYHYYFCVARKKGLCESRYIWVQDLEDAVEAFYDRIRLAPELVTLIRQRLTEVVEHQTKSSRTRKAQIKRELERLDSQESNLLDLVQGGSVPSPKARVRLNEIAVRRIALQEHEATVDQDLNRAAEFLDICLSVIESAGVLYRTSGDAGRKLLNEALFEKLWVFAEDIACADFKEPYDVLISVDDSRIVITESSSEGFASLHPCRVRNAEQAAPFLMPNGSNKAHLVETMGLEPTTPCLQICPIRTVANNDGRIRLVSVAI